VDSVLLPDSVRGLVTPMVTATERPLPRPRPWPGPTASPGWTGPRPARATTAPPQPRY